MDLGSCGECELFGNSIELLGNVEAIRTLGQVVRGFGDETDVVGTGFCPYAKNYSETSLVAEDSPACEHKVEPLYL